MKNLCTTIDCEGFWTSSVLSLDSTAKWCDFKCETSNSKSKVNNVWVYHHLLVWKGGRKLNKNVPASRRKSWGFRDLIIMGALQLNDSDWFIVGSVCKQFWSFDEIREQETGRDRGVGGNGGEGVRNMKKQVWSS